MLKLLTGSAGPYVFGGVLLIVSVLGVSTWVQTVRVGEYKAKYALASGELKQAIEVNSGDQTAIADLQASLHTWQASGEAAANEQAALSLALQQQIAQLSKANAELVTKESRDNVLPQCQSLTAMDLSVCPAHAAAIRLHSASSVSRPSG